jgi:hypothetical protein
MSPTYGDLRFNPCWDDLAARLLAKFGFAVLGLVALLQIGATNWRERLFACSDFKELTRRGVESPPIRRAPPLAP